MVAVQHVFIPPLLFSYWEEDDAAGEITIKKKQHKNTKMMSENNFFFGHVRMVNEVTVFFFNTIFEHAEEPTRSSMTSGKPLESEDISPNRHNFMGVNA
jgi:uncharacterized membrane protein